MMLPTDRWLEMDLTWFDPVRDLKPQIDALVELIAPLLRSVSGQRGIFFNVGWLIDLVTEWMGKPDQLIPTRSRRTAAWSKQRYADLRDFIARLRGEAAQVGLPDLKIGVLFVGWGHVVWPPDLRIYDFESDWYDRHPELYGSPLNFINMPVLHPINLLRADNYPYASFPNGLSENAYFPDFFGAQWAQLSNFLNLDAIHLRDGFTGPMVYTRNGPYGTIAPDEPEKIAAFSQSVCDLYRAVKRANPSKLVFGYSSAISPVADWRVGCVDFESLVADGYIDAWVEQTWGGAWQDWWHQLWKGWTFQAANLLTRGAMVAKANESRSTPCKFYNVIETWDGWEPWDTLHQVPHKLRWGMWAFSLAAVTTPKGIKTPDGSYISWMNNGDGQLLSAADVEYINTHLNQAQDSALKLEKVYGPTVVYNRALMEWLTAEHAAWNVSEWVDDQAALLMKWGTPILQATRAEWLAEMEVPPDALILQTPGQLEKAVLDKLLVFDKAVLATGRADVLDEAVRQKLGIGVDRGQAESGFYEGSGERVPPYDRPYLPTHTQIAASGSTTICYETPQTPLLTIRDNWLYWQPPDWSEPNNPFLPKYQLGSTFPHYRAAALLNDLMRQSGLSHIENMGWSQPLAFHLWRSDGKVYALLGNLETGEFGDARTPREVTLCLNCQQLELGAGDCHLRRVDLNEETLAPENTDSRWLTFRVNLPPEQCAVYRLERIQ